MESTERTEITSITRNLITRFWPSVTWNLRKAQRWSKSVLTFDRCRLDSVTVGLMGYWLRGYEGVRNYCFCKIQLLGQKYRDKSFYVKHCTVWNHSFQCQMYFSVFAAQNLNLRFTFHEIKLEPFPSWLPPLMQPEITGDYFCPKKEVIFNFLTNVWSFLWADKIIWKDCGSNVSSRLLGRGLGWREINGSEGDQD